jgi:hypothetical protein
MVDRCDLMVSIFEEIDYFCHLNFTIMKIKYKIIFLGIILLSVLSCTKNDLKKKTDLENENLNGDVILVSSDENRGRNTFYNGNGFINKIQEKTKIGDESILSISNYNYTNGELSSVEQFCDRFSSTITCFYDPNGVLKSSKIIYYTSGNSFGETYSYYKFDEKGNLLLDSVSPIYLIKNYFTDNIKDSSIDYLSKKITIYSKGLPSKDLFYDISSNGNRNVKSIINYEYKFDEQENWIERKSIINNKENEVVNRKIFYKGDDITEFEKSFNETKNKISTNVKSHETPSRQEKIKSSQKNIKCNNCNGKGVYSCTICYGNGDIKCNNCYYGKTRLSNEDEKVCYKCNGTMRVVCYNCKGNGYANCYECSN